MKLSHRKMFTPYRLTDKVTLKNRVTFANGQHAQSQGPETWPSEIQIAEFAEFCSGGASLACFAHFGKHGGGAVGNRSISEDNDKSHIPIYDYADPSVQNYLSQVAATAHMFGTKIIVKLAPAWPAGCTYGGGDARSLFPLPEGVNFLVNNPIKLKKKFTREEMEARICPKEKIKEVIDEIVVWCKKYQRWGWDGMSFRCDRFIDAANNLRTDEYGGEIENRGRFLQELFAAVRQETGPDFIIEAVLMGRSDHGHDGELPHGYTLDETIRFAKMIEKDVTIIQLREQNGSGYQNSSYNSRPHIHKVLDYCQALRDAGVKCTISANAGFLDPDDIEEALESGVVDLVSTARSFIADPQYAEKLYNGLRPTPCLRCNRCHGTNSAPWLAVCSVNPKTCMTHRLPGIIKPPMRKKKVAVIGGGVIGMRGACFAAERGHEVILFEKTDYLGGKLRYADLYSFKWTFKDYRLWLIEEMKRLGIEVRMNCEPTPQELVEEEFDAVIACTGSRGKRPPVEGADAPGVWTSEDVYEGHAELGQSVVIVGGSEVAVETAMYLAEIGKDVTILTRQDMLMKKDLRPHGVHMQFEKMAPGCNYGGEDAAWSIYPNFKPVYEAVTLRVTPDSVTYKKDDEEVTIHCDSVVVNGGYESCIAEALRYSECAPQFYMAGDAEAEHGGNIQKGNLSVFGKASLI